MKIDTWDGCYPSNWRGKIVPDAITHPAKYSSKLIRRIYEHMIAEGWLREGDLVIDPFGGVALGAFDAMRLGLRWRGNELEPRFVDIGQNYDCPGYTFENWKRFYYRVKRVNHTYGFHWCPTCQGVMQNRKIRQNPHRYIGNIEYWNSRFSSMPHWCTDAILLNGDSRHLLDVLSQADGAVSSPPYKTGGHHKHQMDAYNTNGGGQYDKDHSGYGTGDGIGIGVVSSPPYAGTLEKPNGIDTNKLTGHHAGATSQAFLDPRYGATPGQLGAMKADGFDAAVTSPPFLQAKGGTPEPKPGGPINAAMYKRHAAGNAAAHAYGKTEGQLSSMDDGSFDAAVTSPPFKGQSADGGWQMLDKYAKKGKLTVKQAGGDPSKSFPSWSEDRDTSYGHTEGQLADMDDKDFDGAVSSPPYESADLPQAARDYSNLREHLEKSNHRTMARSAELMGSGDYGHTEGNIGNDSGDDFWMAARQIVEQVYIALRPGGHAVWVVKGFVKNKDLVDFPGQWRQLCEAVGFVAVHEHHASLVRHNSTSITLEGKKVKNITESKSFFRRLAEKKGSPHIDFETVLCMVKP
jgi:hypothetical protein